MASRLETGSLALPLRRWLGARVAALLDEHGRLLDEPMREKASFDESLLDLGQRVARLDRELRARVEEARWLGRPFAAEMSIQQALTRHPGALQVFARHHLPGCDGCAVRFDETVGEAAAAYGLDLDALIRDLDALLA